jgi:hypothetical protein
MEENVENQQEKTNVKTKSNFTSISEILKRLIQKIDILSVTVWSKYLYSQFILTASVVQLQGKTDIRPLQYRTFIFATIQRGLYWSDVPNNP